MFSIILLKLQVKGDKLVLLLLLQYDIDFENKVA